MLSAILASHFAHGFITGGLLVAARDLAGLLIAGIVAAFSAAEKHPNAYVTPGMEETAKHELLTDIATDAAKAAHTTNVAVTVTSGPAVQPVIHPELQSQKDAPQYNED